MAETKATRGRKRTTTGEQVKAHSEASTKTAEGLEKGTGAARRKGGNIAEYNAALTQEERTEAARRAGKASAAARYKKGLIREACQTIMASSVEDPELSEACEKLGVENSFAYATAIAIGRKALAGDAEAARYLRDTAGEKPREAIDMAIDKPIQSRDMSEVSDEELEAMAEGLDEG